MKIYFAGSITGGRGDKELYAEIIELLSRHGKVLTEHIGHGHISAMGEMDVTPEYIYGRDVAWLTDADVLVAEVSTPSLGVGYEIGFAESQSKKILCLYREIPGKKVSSMIKGNQKLVVKKYQNTKDIETILSDFFA